MMHAYLVHLHTLRILMCCTGSCTNGMAPMVQDLNGRRFDTSSSPLFHFKIAATGLVCPRHMNAAVTTSAIVPASAAVLASVPT